MHTTTYNLCLKLINLGKTDGLMDKVDVYYLAGRITEEEYKDLAERLNPVDLEPVESEPEVEA